jgi:uncharacterized delta-60 repeat protein
MTNFSLSRRAQSDKTNFTSLKSPILQMLGLCLCAVLSCWQAVGAAPGDLDPTFSGDGKLTDYFPGTGNDNAAALAVQADGKIVVVGTSDYAFDRACSLSRFNPDGSLDASFAGTGKLLQPQIDDRYNSCTAVAVQTDGKIVVVGSVSNVNSDDSDFLVFRYNPNGTLDTSFGGSGTGWVTTVFSSINDRAQDVAIQADGKIVVTGSTNNVAATSPSDFAVARYNPDGTLDTTFDMDGKVVTPMQSTSFGAAAVALQPDGKIVAGGTTNSTSFLVSDFALVRYNTDGSLDTSFDMDGKVVTDIAVSSAIYDIALQPDGKIVAAGESFSSAIDFTLARYNPNGSLDASFDMDGIVTTAVISAGDGARAVALQPDGKIVAAGYAFRGSTMYDFVLVRYNPNGALDTSFDTDGKVTTQFTNSADGFTDVAILADGKIIGTGSPVNGTDTDFALLRYNANGALDTGFDTDGIAYADIGAGYAIVHGVAVQADGKVVTAGYTYNGTNTDFAVARYNTDGSPDPSFGGGTGKVSTPVLNRFDYGRAVVIQPDGKIIVAGAAQPTAGNQFALVRYNPDGTLDTSFDTDGKVTTSFTGTALDGAKSLALQADGKIVAAGTIITGGATDFALARYNPDGSLDTSFDGDGRVTTPVLSSYDYANSVAIQPDGKIVAAGYTDSGAFNYDFALVRYNADGLLDTSFDTDGKVTNPVLSGEDMINAVTIQPDGKIVAAGHADDGTELDFALARYTPDGALDTSFHTDGKVTTPVFSDEDSANAVIVLPDGKIIAAGYAETTTSADFAVVRYQANGALDNAYGAGGKVMFDFGSGDFDEIKGIALDGSGRAVVAGIADDGLMGVARLLGDSAPTSVRTPFDFDGDGRADISLFRPDPDENNNYWYLRQSSDGGLKTFEWGVQTDKIAPADYDGDGKTDFAVWRENAIGNMAVFYIYNSADNSIRIEQFGLTGDKLTVGDWDGDGKADLAVYRGGAQSVFYYRGSLNNPSGITTYVPWGIAEDKPARGDFDGDGKFDAAVFRPSNGTWYIRQSSNGGARYENWGLASDELIPADYDGDGKTDLAVFRGGVWYIRQSSNGSPRYETFGLAGDRLVPADYDGDGKTDIAVFRNGAWYIKNSLTSSVSAVGFGVSTDVSVPGAYNNP